MAHQVTEHPLLSELVSRLRDAAGDRLLAVVLYGSAARGDFHDRVSDFNVLLELRDLELPTLATLGDPVAWWLRKHQPMPRIFSPEVIAGAADVFPIEFLDISQHHVVLFGEDPFAALEVHTDHLRIQCERELREKLMRVREAYIEARGKPRLLQRLLAESFPTFLALFRGCLHLRSKPVPAHNAEVIRAFCELADLDEKPFLELEELLDHHRSAPDPVALLERYYRELTRAVAAIDRFEHPSEATGEPAGAPQGDPS
jgi:hypothetical protein